MQLRKRRHRITSENSDMSVLLDEIKIYAQDLEQRVSQLRSIADQSPEGSLCLRRSGRSVFYAVRRTENGRRTKKYLPKDNERAIRAYSRKMLSEKELPVLEKNLKAARSFIAIHSGREEEDVAECIAPEILEYCADLYVTEDRRVREWLNSKGPESPWADSQPNIKTSAGYMVRSKSEAIISNSLSAHKKVHLYEKALYLETKQYAIFPDFTIYDPKTGR